MSGGREEKGNDTHPHNAPHSHPPTPPPTEYAQVIKMLGNNRLEAQCIDGVKRLCHIRGKMRKKVWVNAGDVVLLGLREFQDEKADVILKYAADEARSLKAYGELPENSECGWVGGERVVWEGSVVFLFSLFAHHQPSPHPPPTSVRVNEADAFANEEGGENDDFFDFDDVDHI